MIGDIVLRDLTVRYGDTVAVDGVDLELVPGKIYGLLGRNGSGKTSLLSVLAGYRRPTSTKSSRVPWPPSRIPCSTPARPAT